MAAALRRGVEGEVGLGSFSRARQARGLLKLDRAGVEGRVHGRAGERQREWWSAAVDVEFRTC